MRDSWTLIRLGELFALDNRKLGAHDEEPPVFSLSKYSGVVHAEEYFDKRIASAKLDGYKVLEPGAWAYSTIHIDEGSIALNTLGHTGVLSPMYTTMRWVSEDHEPQFFVYLLRSSDLLNMYRAHAKGSVNRRRSLSYNAFAALEIAVPSVAEQRRMVDLIDSVGSVQELAERVAAATATARALISAEWFADANHDVFDLSEVATVVQGSSLPTELQGAQTGEVPWFKIADMGQPANIFGYVAADTMVSLDEIEARGGRVLPAGTVAFPRVGGAVKTERKRILLRSAACDENHLAVLPSDSVLPGVVLAYFENLRLGELARSGAVPSLNQRLIRSLRIPVPSAEAQARFVELIDALRVEERDARLLSARAATALEAILADLISGRHEIPASYDELLEHAS